MTVEIVSPDKALFKGEASYVKLPGAMGSFGVMENHAATISTLEKGQLKIVSGNDEQVFEVSGGVVEVYQNKIIVLVD